MLSEWELNWAYNYNTILSEGVKCMQVARTLRRRNPWPRDTWQWLTWEEGIREYKEYVESLKEKT